MTLALFDGFMMNEVTLRRKKTNSDIDLLGLNAGVEYRQTYPSSILICMPSCTLLERVQCCFNSIL